MYKEINIEKIKTLEKDLLNTVSEIKNILSVEDENFLKNKKNIYSLRYLLIEAVETMANICNHIITRLKGDVPKGYSDCFEKLFRAGAIPEELGNKLIKLARLRNIIIHKYWEIDDRKILSSTRENLPVFVEFLDQINEFLKLK